MKNILLRILILVTILSGAAYFIYKDYSSVSSHKPSTATSTPIRGGIKIIPITEEKRYKFLDQAAMPDLQKKWSIPDSFSSDAKRIIDGQVSILTNDLTANPNQFDKWIELGAERKLIGDYGEAEKIWRFSAENWPDSIISYHNLGDLYASYLKDYAKAEKNMLKVISLDPSYISEYGALSMLYKQMYGGQDARVAGILLQGLNNNSGTVDLMTLLASHYKEVGDKTNAAKYFEMALTRAKQLGNVPLQGAFESELKNL